jgi:Aspartyl/Asparaginyl beta-hydroxylase
VSSNYAICSVDPMLAGEPAEDVAHSKSIVDQLERQSPFLMAEDWLSIPLINATGSSSDHGLEPRGAVGVPTEYWQRLPWTRKAVEFIEAQGLCIEHARLLVLRPLGVFWPHKDTHSFFRLLLPLYADGGECLYLLGGDSYLADVGKFYYLQPDVYHAALNLTDQERLVVCLDITSNRKALDFVLKFAEKTEPRSRHLRFGSNMRVNLELMVTAFGESEPLLACKLAMALGSCLLDGTFEDVQDIIYNGLLKCSQGRMTGNKIEELEKLFSTLERHPYYPAVAHSSSPGLFDDQNEQR